ncbi:MAG: hypothetical protein WCK57_05010 [Verrucomicrobiae bacterium]
MRNSFIIIFTLLLVSCKSSQPASDSVEITADRAWHLAAIYDMQYISCSGGVGDVVAKGNYWEVPVHVDLVSTTLGNIRVNRHTGDVSYGWRHPEVSAKSLDQWFTSATNGIVLPNSEADEKSPSPK